MNSVIVRIIATAALTFSALPSFAQLSAKEVKWLTNYNYIQGREAFDNSDFVSAKAYFQKALDDDPNNAFAYYNLANIAYRANSLSSIPLYKKVLELAPEDHALCAKVTYVLYPLYRHYHPRFSREYEDYNRFYGSDGRDYAEVLSNACVDACKYLTGPAAADGYCILADYYGTFSDRQGEEFEAAQKAVEASPLSGNAQMALALAYGKAGRYEDALKCCLKRDKLIDNRWLGSNFYVEVVKLLNGDYEAAIRNLIALACGTSDSYERKESIEFLSTAELEEGEFYPNANQRIDRRRFNVLVDLLLKDAIVSNPGVLAYQYLLGAMYEGREQYAQAAAAYGKAVDAYGAEAAYKQFDCLMKLRDYSSALATLNSYSSAHSDDPEFYEKRAMLRELVGEDKDSILADYDRIVELCGSLAYERKKAFEKRAGFERRNGMTEEAILDYTAALYEKSSHQDYMLRGFLFLSLGDSALAEEDFRMVDYYAKTSTYAFSAFGLGKEYAVSQMKTYVDECKLGNYNYDDYYDDDDSDEEEDTEADARYYLACLYSLNGECDLSIKELKAAIRNGYDNLVNIKKEPFLDKARQDPAFNDVLKYYDELHAPVSPAMSPAPSLKTVENNEFVLEVHFSKKGGVLEVPCVVNGLPLSFIFDSGASDVSLSPVEAKFMINNGYVAKSDIGDKAYYRNADGSLSKSTRLLLKSVMFGGETLSNVWASVSEGQSAPLLLGQSALSRLGKVEIDYDKEVIRIRCNWWR